MKEVTVIETVEITRIFKNVPDCFVMDNEAIKETDTQFIKERLNVDDVVMTNVQVFEMENKHE